MTPERLQSLFNTVKEHLLTQNQRSKSYDECAYRGDNGLMCAVGCLIKNEYYSEKLEGIGVTLSPATDLKEKVKSLIGAIEDSLGYSLTRPELSLLRDLQQIHDHECVGDWKKELDSLEQRLEYISNHHSDHMSTYSVDIASGVIDII